MLAAALTIAVVAFQAHWGGVFSKRLLIFSLIVAVGLIGSLAFVPIALIFIWALIVAAKLIRSVPATV